MNKQVLLTLNQRSDRWLKILCKGLVIIAMILLAVLTTLIALQVGTRNFLNIGLPWADELARFAGLAVVFFTVPLLQYYGRHISVDMLSSRLSGVPSTILRCINEAAVLAFCVLLLMSFADFLKRAAHFSTPATGMPNWLFYAPALLGILACTLVTLLRLMKGCTGNNMNLPYDAGAGEEDIS